MVSQSVAIFPSSEGERHRPGVSDGQAAMAPSGPNCPAGNSLESERDCRSEVHAAAR